MSQTLHEEPATPLDPQAIERGLFAAIAHVIVNGERVPWEVQRDDLYRAWEEHRAQEKAGAK